MKSLKISDFTLLNYGQNYLLILSFQGIAS